MAALTNTQISVTYVGLLKTNSSTVLSGTAQQIVDGAGTASPLYLSTSSLGIGGSPTAGKELDVTGNVLITGDLQIDNINIDGNTISATSGVVTLQDGTIATTQSQGDNSTKLATTAYVDAAIGANDTLAEILANGNTTGGSNIVISAGDDITFTDTSEALFGSSNDLAIFHNGTYSELRNNTGTLNIRQRVDDGDVQILSDNGDGSSETVYFRADGGTGQAQLFYYGSIKLNTTSTGIDVTGRISNLTDPSAAQDAATKNYVDTQVGANNELSEVLANGNTTGGTDIAVSAGDDITFTSTSKAIFGASSDLQVYSDGSNNYIDSTSNELRIRTNDLRLLNYGTGKYITADSGADVSLYYNNSKKFETTSTGVRVTGEVYIDGTGNWSLKSDVISGNLVLKDETNNADRVDFHPDGQVEILYAGVATTPSLIFNNDINTGIFHPSNDNLAFATAGSERMRIDSSGNVLIKQGILEVQSAGNVAETNKIKIGTHPTAGYGSEISTSTLYNSYLYTDLRFSTTNASGTLAERFVIASNGDVYNYQSSNKANTYYGYLAGNYGGTGTSNNAFGYDALRNVSTGTNNIAMGRASGFALTTGTRNTLYGGQSGIGITTGNYNTILGFNAGSTQTGSSYVTAVGDYALANNAASYNTAIGQGAGQFNTTGAYNTSLGQAALQYVTSGSYNIGIGYQAGDGITTPNNNIAIGALVMSANTVTGTQNVCIGTSGMYNLTSGNYNTGVGEAVMASLTSGSYNTAMGREALDAASTGDASVAIGYQSLTDANANGNTAVGFQSGYAVSSGAYNVIMGHEAGVGLTSGSYNILMGDRTGRILAGSSENVLIGHQTGYSLTGQYNACVGFKNLNATSSGNFNASLGFAALNRATSSSNTAVGGYALHYLTSGTLNVAMGYQALFNTTSDGNTAIGYTAMQANTTGGANTAIGVNAGLSNTTGGNNTFLGYEAGHAQTTSNENTYLGFYAGRLRTGGIENTIVGSQAGYTAGSGNNNTLVGRATGYNLTTGATNTLIGHQSGFYMSTGYENTALGHSALAACSTGAGNIGIGVSAGYNMGSGGSNIAIGYAAMNGTTAISGTHNTVIGDATGYYVSSGSNNLLLGKNAGRSSSPFGANLTTESNRIVLGDNSISNAYIKVSWTVTSDARDKGNIKEVPHGLDFVSQLKPKSFEFKPDRDSEETDGIERYGFLAQDVLELEGDNPVVIDTEHENNLKLKESNLIPILVNAIKELKQEIETLKSQINN